MPNSSYFFKNWFSNSCYLLKDTFFVKNYYLILTGWSLLYVLFNKEVGLSLTKKKLLIFYLIRFLYYIFLCFKSFNTIGWFESNFLSYTCCINPWKFIFSKSIKFVYILYLKLFSISSIVSKFLGLFKNSSNEFSLLASPKIL